jgi:hypothetical protein
MLRVKQFNINLSKEIKMKVLLLSTIALILVSCEATTSTAQDEHFEPVAVILASHDGEALSTLYDSDRVSDATAAATLNLKKGDTLELDVKFLCGPVGTTTIANLTSCDLKDGHENHDHEEGHEDGHEDGHKEGHEEGHEDGHKEGHEDGHKDGHEEGHEDGHKEGHEDGHEDGKIGDLEGLSLKIDAPESITVIVDNFEIKVVGLTAGAGELSLNVMHNGHVDIADKKFPFIVSE